MNQFQNAMLWNEYFSEGGIGGASGGASGMNLWNRAKAATTKPIKSWIPTKPVTPSGASSGLQSLIPSRAGNDSAEAPEKATAKKNNKLPYIIGGALLVAGLGFVYYKSKHHAAKK